MMRSLRRFAALLVWDFKLQFRYYFWATGVVVTLVWVGLLLTLSDEVIATWVPVLIFADIGNIGLIFIAGILYLERRQGTIYVAAIMPVSPATWLTLKLVSLAILCTACALVIVFFNSESVNWIRIVPAALLCAALFTSIGFLLAVPFDRIMNYFFGMALGLGVLNLPILDYLGIIEHPLMWLLPSQAAMQLLAGSFQEMSAPAFYGAALVLLGWIALLHWLGIRAYGRFVTERPQV